MSSNKIHSHLNLQGFKKQALVVSRDSQHRFELALELGDLQVAHTIALSSDSDERWKQLAQASTVLLTFECVEK